MSRVALIKFWQQAEKTTCMDTANTLYNNILSAPDLIKSLKPAEILAVRHNRAINNIEVANWYLENRLYTRSLTHFQFALADRMLCNAGYETKASAALVAESQRFIAHVSAKLDEQAAVIPPFEGNTPI